MKNLLISLDIGTQGTKCILFDESLSILASAFEPSILVSPKPGTVWQEADDLYGAVVRTISSVIREKNISPSDVAAIGLDGQMAGIMGIDVQGQACTCYDSWLDTRCAPYVKIMREKAGKRITELTGGPVTYTHGPKILWWKHEQPEVWAKIHKFVLPHAYLVGRMCGLSGEEATFDYTHLQYSGFGDNKNKTWSAELLREFDIDANKMARIVSPFDVVGVTTREFARQTGLIEGIPVVAGAGDTAASLLGAGVFEQGMMMDCAGTASVLCSVVDSFVPDLEHETLTMVRAAVDGLWYPLAYINGGGLCLRWFRDEFTGTPHMDYDQLEKEALDIPPGCEGLSFVPHFDGRVLPSNPHIKGGFIGLNWKHTRAHLYRAIMESIACEYRYYFDVTRTLYPRRSFEQLFAMGGGANSPLFNQIKADVLGLQITTCEMSDTSLIGSAVIAGTGVGLFSDCKEPIRRVAAPGRTFFPNSENYEIYQNNFKRYQRALDAVAAIYKP
ncbi:MAG: FGGY family carbohydrate kinase [Planctomycetia bacterium]|nr:FGGY family carbohydrate kinase [Planctomycetia bacterium]